MNGYQQANIILVVCIVGLIFFLDRSNRESISKDQSYEAKVDSISQYYHSKIDSLQKKKDSIQIVTKEKIVKIKSEPIIKVIDHSFNNFLKPIDSNYTVKVNDSLVCIDSSTFRNSVVEAERTNATLLELGLDDAMCHDSLNLHIDRSRVIIDSKDETIKELKKTNFKLKIIGYGSATILGLLLLNSYL